MASVFLSYARTDRDCAKALTGLLEGAGHEVWWDQQIGGGSEFGEEIEAALAKCDIVLVAWSKASVKSRWVRDEAGLGGDTGRLLPVSIDGSVPPMGFRQFQTIELTGWKGANKDPRANQLLQAIDLRFKGAKNTQVARATPHSPRLVTWKRPPVLAVAAALILVIIGGSALYYLTWRDQPFGSPTKPTMALLPLTAPAGDRDLTNIAEQARNSIGHALSESGVPVRRMNSASANIGKFADYVISGELNRNQRKLVATIRMDEPIHGVTIFSKRFEAEPGDTANLPERIGAQMAGTLTWAGPLMVLDRRHPSDPSITADLLQASDFSTDPLQAYQIAQRAVAKAPNSAIAQVSLAFFSAAILDQLPREERERAVVAARRANERALTLAPDFGDTYASWCLLHSETRMVKCEDQIRAGKRIDPNAPFLNIFHARLLRAVGRFKEAAEFTQLSYAHDPYVPTKIGSMLRTLESEGDASAAKQLYQQGVRWWPEFKDYFFRARATGILTKADFADLLRLEQEIGPKNLPQGYVESGPLVTSLRAKSLASTKRSCAVDWGMLGSVRCMLAFATLGDNDNAFALADKLYPPRIGRTPAETERIWLDAPDGSTLPEFITSRAAAPMRRDSRYLQLAQRLGLLDYWRSGRPPDFCRQNPEPVCKQLLKKS